MLQVCITDKSSYDVLTCWFTECLQILGNLFCFGFFFGQKKVFSKFTQASGNIFIHLIYLNVTMLTWMQKKM